MVEDIDLVVAVLRLLVLVVNDTCGVLLEEAEGVKLAVVDDVTLFTVELLDVEILVLALELGAFVVIVADMLCLQTPNLVLRSPTKLKKTAVAVRRG